LKFEDLLPIIFHADHRPFVDGDCIERFVETTETRFTVIGVFALCIGVALLVMLAPTQLA